MADRYMLSTSDNPFNPSTDFKAWLAFDTSRGYHTLPLLARVTITSNELSEADQLLAINDAIDEIISENVSGMHIKVPVVLESVEQF